MSTVFPRTDRSLLGTWWWTVDRVLLAGVLVLVFVGLLIVLAASPPVGVLRHKDPHHFIVRHLAFTVPAVLLLFACSLLAPLGVLRMAKGLAALGVLLMVLAVLDGPEINGAHRWVRIGGLQLQPSEFVKPALVVLTAWLASTRPWYTAGAWSLALASVVVGLLLLQPDLGMAAIVLATLGLQLFVAGLPWILVLAFAGLGIGGAFAAYELFPHVAARVDQFMAPPAEFTQIEKALRAVASGGLFGRCPTPIPTSSTPPPPRSSASWPACRSPGCSRSCSCAGSGGRTRRSTASARSPRWAFSVSSPCRLSSTWRSTSTWSRPRA